MKIGLPAVIFFAVFSLSRPAFAQSNQEDSAFYQSALVHTGKLYMRQLGDQSPLFNGSLYAEYPFTFKEGSPYFPSANFSPGQVVYDGILFDSLSLLYDQLRQFLILKKGEYLLQLINERISSFSILGHDYVRLIADSSNPGISRTGFYEVLYPGRSRVLKVTYQNIQEQASITEGVIHFIEFTDYYYVRRNKGYIRVKSKSELIDCFPDRQKDIQHFMRKNKLKFKKDRDGAIIQVAGYYDQLAK